MEVIYLSMRTNFNEAKLEKSLSNFYAATETARYKNVMGFFLNKSLLKSNREIKPVSNKISIKDVLLIGESVEPRVLELLPAAILHFPKSFTDLDKIPHELANIIKLIKSNSLIGPEYKSVDYATFKKWAEFQFKDGRVKPESMKRVTCSLRLSKKSYQKLKQLSRDRGLTMSAIVEELILHGAPSFLS